jgi:hypothetical protein
MGMKTSTAAVVAAVTLGLFAIIGWLNINHVDTANYFLMLPAVLPAVAALFGVSNVKSTTDTIKTNTNGTLSALTAQKLASDTGLMHALAFLTPEQAATVLAAMSGNSVAATLTSVATTPAPTPTPAPAPTPEPAPAPAAAPLAPVPAPAAPTLASLTADAPAPLPQAAPTAGFPTAAS